MPQLPLKPCRVPRCAELVRPPATKCVSHARLEMRATASKFNAAHGSPAKRGYDRKWTRYRKVYLAYHPFCVDPRRIHGPLVPSEEVDHIIPHCGDMILFWDPANHQALCTTCHSRKTAREDGGFGNPYPHENTADNEQLKVNQVKC
jgi:5-methylcytosine-specific restriction enzyme A